MYIYISQMELKLGRMACSLMFVWMVAWTPYAVMTVWILFFDPKLITANIALIPTLCCKVSAALNAFIYGSR